jgi:hypothetical protein
MLDGDELEIEFDFANLMRGDAASRSAYYQSGIQNGWLTRNEARIAENLNPIKGLDQPLRPLNMVEEEDAEAQEPEDEGTDAADADTPVEPDQQMSQRLRKLIEANAQRLARRISKKGRLDAQETTLIAQALGLQEPVVRAWALSQPSADEPVLLKALIQLGNST